MRIHWKIVKEGATGPNRLITHHLYVNGVDTELWVGKFGYDKWEKGGKDWSAYCYTWQAGRIEILRYWKAHTEGGK